jgi:hypothetical protein
VEGNQMRKYEGSHCFDFSRPLEVTKGRREEFDEPQYKENYNERMCCFYLSPQDMVFVCLSGLCPLRQKCKIHI